MARIVLNETSYHGAGCIKEIPGEVARRGLNKAFVCSDPDLVKFGVTKKVLDVLDEAKIAYTLYSNIIPNPPSFWNRRQTPPASASLFRCR